MRRLERRIQRAKGKLNGGLTDNQRQIMQIFNSLELESGPIPCGFSLLSEEELLDTPNLIEEIDLLWRS